MPRSSRSVRDPALKVDHDPIGKEALSSIGPADANCGDKAKQEQEACSKFNHWSTFAKMMSSVIERRGD